MVTISGRADRFEQIVKSDEIDAVALLEIGLGFAGHDRGEMKDRIRTTADQPAARILARYIERVSVDLAGKSRRRFRRHHIDQGELVDRLAVQPAVRGEPLGQLAPDHARRPGNENVHAVVPPTPLSSRKLPKAAIRDPYTPTRHGSVRIETWVPALAIPRRRRACTRLRRRPG